MSHNVFTENIKIDLAEIERLSHLVDRFVKDHGISTKMGYHLNLILDEVLTNTITHAKADSICVRLDYDAPVVSLQISDNGQAFNPLTDTKAPDLDASLDDRAIGGLGIHFAKTFMSNLAYDYQDNHNILTLTLDTTAKP